MLLYLYIKKKKKPQTLIQQSITQPLDIQRKVRKLKTYSENIPAKREKVLTKFLLQDYDEDYFKVLPTQEQCVTVFEALESENYLHHHILNDTDDIVIEKFRELFPDIIKSEFEIERDEELEYFIETWLEADKEDFKKLPTKKMCVEVFIALEKLGLSHVDITSDDELVLKKFNELYPSYTYSQEEKELREELEYFLEEWSTWDGNLEEYKHLLVKKPTKKQMTDVFKFLVQDGTRPNEILYCHGDDIFKRLIQLFPDLQK